MSRSARPVVWIGLCVFAIAAASSYRHGQDFGVFWTAGRRFVVGADLFPPTDPWLGWRYMPGTAALFAPLAALPLGIAKALWLAVLAVTGSLALAWLVPGGSRPDGGSDAMGAAAGRARPWVLAIVALAIVSRPLLEEFACAQVNLVVLALLLLAFRAEDRDMPVRAGLLLALPIALKAAPALFLVDAALRRRWRVLAGAAAGGVVLAVVALPFYGWSGTIEVHRAWFASQTRLTPTFATSPGNQSLFALVARLGGPEAIAVALAAIVTVVALRARPPEPRRSLLLLVTALASPMGWIQNYVFALPAAVRLAPSRYRGVAAALGLALLVAIYDVTGPRVELWVFRHSIPLALAIALFAATLTAPTAQCTVRDPG